jgi:hypothetical protein
MLVAAGWLIAALAVPHGAHAQSVNVLYSFCKIKKFDVCQDGSQPVGALVSDGSGNLYGVTVGGGSGNNAFGGGTVFELSNQSGSWSESVLYNFCSDSGCPDGEYPAAGLAINSGGYLSGTGRYSGSTHLPAPTKCSTASAPAEAAHVRMAVTLREGYSTPGAPSTVRRRAAVRTMAEPFSN